MHACFGWSVLDGGLDLLLDDYEVAGCEGLHVASVIFQFPVMLPAVFNQCLEYFLLLFPEWERTVDVFECLLALGFVIPGNDVVSFEVDREWEFSSDRRV